jgi:phenylpropionate dioxygenase-like ring-hydroxylating dioxygenase large terminal subunit
MTPDDHKLLSETAKGTPMGELLRRYWMPAVLSRELVADGAPVRVELLGEKLIAFRNSDGKVGLLREFCAHRGASLYFARNGEGGLRCWYHGWKWDTDGNCLDQPNMPEDRRFCDKVKQTAYPCIEKNGAVWTYMGPRETMPGLPELEWLTVPASHVYVTKRIQLCHWTQGMDGDMDGSHVAFLHDNVLDHTKEQAGQASTALMKAQLAPHMEVEWTPAGIALGVRREIDATHFSWRVNQWMLPGFTMIPPFPGDHPILGHSWVPIDDTRSWLFVFSWHPSRPLTQDEVDYMAAGNNNTHIRLIPGTWMPRANASNEYAGPDAPPAKQPWMRVKDIQDQDVAATESMGPLYDRTQETLCVQDIAIVNARRRLIEAARGLMQGMEPPGRDPADYRLRSISTKLPKDTKDWLKGIWREMEAVPETYKVFAPER